MGVRRGLLLLGEPEGLAGRRGEDKTRPAISMPGIDLVRAMVGGARLAADLDLVWNPESGEVVLGRYGSDRAGGVVHEGETGDSGSVDLRIVGGLCVKSKLGVIIALGCCSRSVGTGEE
jgi:hypothetical protein